MKKLLLLCICCFAPVFSLWAQDEDGKSSKVEIGLQHSFNLTTLIGNIDANVNYGQEDKVKTKSPRITFDAGFFANTFLGKRVSIQTELLYTYMGAHMREQTTVYHDLYKYEEDNDFTYALSYMKLPLVLNIYPHERYFIQAGVYGAALISASKYYPWTLKKRDVIDDPSRLDGGLVVGAGVDLKIVNLTFRYNYGLIDVFQNDNTQNLHNSVLQLNINWKIYRSH